VRSLRDKVIVVTGASSGVGRAVARACAARGARLALIARNGASLERAAAEVAELGGRALALPLDVSDSAAVDEAAERIAAEWGGIDVWINDAMVSVLAPVELTTPDEYRRVMEVNYLGYVHGTLAALRHMRRVNSGVIVQIGSALAYRSIPLQSAYCASKAAVRAFMDSLRSELIRERSKIALTMVQLPAVNTPQFDVMRNRLEHHPQPVPPVYQPELIAKAVVHAALHPRRELWLGWSTVKAILAQRLVPGFLDRYLARHGWEAQQTADLPPGHPRRHFRDNLDAPLPGDRGAHGPFDDRARSFDVPLWVRLHPKLTAAAAAVAAVAIAAAVRSTARAALPAGRRSPQLRPQPRPRAAAQSGGATTASGTPGRRRPSSKPAWHSARIE
jgi:NADP-dependent 3-hydroxy acid dehydrogenase YdfG